MKKSEIKPTSTKDYLGAVFLIILFFGGVLITWNVTRSKNSNLDKSPQTISQPTINCPNDPQSYSLFLKDKIKVLPLINNETAMFADNGRFVNLKRVISKSETKESKVACGYIKIQAGTKDIGALQSWENIFINPNGFGGHIDPTNQIGLGDGREYSEYVFPLSKINYWKTRADRVRNNLSQADWASLLNVSDKITFEIALNSQDKTGFIKEVSVAYKCWNPTTGEENDKCNLNVIDESKTESSNPIN